MVRLLTVLVLSGLSAQAQTITETFGSGANQFSIDFVQIGNPGNAADSGINSFNNQPYTAGSVSSVYNLGKYEISQAMIEKANALADLGLTLMAMPWSGGNRPAVGISWNEAARFVNWLNTSKGYQAAYNFTTSGPNDNISLWGESESSQGNGGLLNRFRHKDAYYFLPSLDEWYKGAYGTPSGNWYKFSTGSDTIPVAVSGGTEAGTAVYNQPVEDGPADITSAGGLSSFGTMAQGGNVWEFTESAKDGVNDNATEPREMGGGKWWRENFFGSTQLLAASDRIGGYDVGYSANDAGFRIASVPEPSSLSLLLAGGVVALARRRKV